MVTSSIKEAIAVRIRTNQTRARAPTWTAAKTAKPKCKEIVPKRLRKAKRTRNKQERRVSWKVRLRMARYKS